MGPAVDHMASVVQADLAAKGLAMARLHDPYSADSVDDLKPNSTVLSLLKAGSVGPATAEYIHSSVDRYDASIAQGIKDAEGDVATALAACPTAKLILAGYSQGAIAVHDAENFLAARKPGEFSHVAGTLLLGDPDRVPHTKAKLFGTSAAGAEGLRVYLHLVRAHDVPAPSTTANIANAGDLVGDFKLSHVRHFSKYAAVHTGYAHLVNGALTYESILASAADWVASKIPGIGAADPGISVQAENYGKLPAGTVTTKQLSASGGVAPYSFRIYSLDYQQAPSWVTLSTGGTLRISPPAGTSATVSFHVFVTDHERRSSPFTASTILFTVGLGGASDLSFPHHHQVLGAEGIGPPDVECTSKTFCLALGTGGELHSYNGSRWTSDQVPSQFGVGSFSCAGAGFCAAVTGIGEVFISSGGSSGGGWADAGGLGESPGSVSCFAAGQCLVASTGSTGRSTSFLLAGGMLTDPVPMASGRLQVTGIGCASGSFCVATGVSTVTGAAFVAAFDGASWSAFSKLALTGPVTCVRGGSCYAIDGSGNADRFTASGHVSIGKPGGARMTAFSCASGSWCEAGNSAGGVATYNGRTWKSGPVVLKGSGDTGIETLSCPVAGFCVGQTFEGYSTVLKNGSWSGLTRTDPDGFVLSVSCPTATFCAALDSVGEVAFLRGSAWSRAAMVDPQDFGSGGISCTSASFCAMADGNGRVYLYNGSHWSQGATVTSALSGGSPLASVSCASPAMCEAIGISGDAYSFNGRTWSKPFMTGLEENGYLQAVSCPSTTFCMAVGGDAAATYSSGSWSKPVAIAPASASLHAVSCISPAFCLAGDRESADVAAYYDGRWSKPWSVSPAPFFVSAISCLGVYRCVAVGDLGGAYLTGTSATRIGVPDQNNDEAFTVDCPLPSSCVAGTGDSINW